MRFRVMYLGLILSVFVVNSAFGRQGAADEPARKIALLVGVNEYRDRPFAGLTLRFAERDVTNLSAELKRHGFKVHLLTGTQATRSKIEEELKKALNDRTEADLFLLGFSGQGVQTPLRDAEGKLVKDERGVGRKDVSLCPVDAVLGEASTMISLTELIHRPGMRRGLNLVLLDACRNKPSDADASEVRAITGEELSERVPGNSVIYFGCAAGQQGLESSKAGGGHGLFFYHVIEALRGDRGVSSDSTKVTWDDLTHSVNAEVKLRAHEWWGPDDVAVPFDVSLPQGKIQTPHLLGSLGRNPVLARIKRASPEPPGLAESIGIKLRLIPAGTFQMGTTARWFIPDDEQPRHEVRISRAFYLSATEVTQGQYRAVTGESPSRFEGADDLPVERVSWHDAVRFCNKLSVKENLPPFYEILGEAVSVPDWKGVGYRLPTEAEWEYACRAGNSGYYSFGDDTSELRDYGWYYGNSGQRTHPVGQKPENKFGLYDMHGNVSEWCWDGWAPDYYKQSPRTDPLGPVHGAVVMRGGSWLFHLGLLRSASRMGVSPFSHSSDTGFRIARGQLGR